MLAKATLMSSMCASF